MKTIWIAERGALTRAEVEERGEKTYAVKSSDYIFGFAYAGKTLRKDDWRICNSAPEAFNLLYSLAEKQWENAQKNLEEAAEEMNQLGDIVLAIGKGKDAEAIIANWRKK